MITGLTRAPSVEATAKLLPEDKETRGRDEHEASALCNDRCRRRCPSRSDCRRRACNPQLSLYEENVMKLTVTTILTTVAMIAGSMTAFAGDDDSRARDIVELKDLHVAFHQAVSHAGTDPATKLAHVEAVLALWTDDGTLIAGGVTYSGKGTPGTASCDLGAMTLCDLYTNHAGAFVLGHNWVSLTPIFTEAITVLDRHNADIYFQCIYFDVNNNDKLVSNVTFGLPGMPGTGRAKKVHGHWLFSYGQVASIAPPTLDVY
jgi:hypothetical protein